MIGFGLDPAGYISGKSALAVAKRQGSKVRVWFLRGCPFSRPPNDDREIARIVDYERSELSKITKLGCIAIDIPLDLQSLPKICNPTHLWQLTKRKVDKAVGGLEPLASFIGHVTARFQSILCDPRLECEIGRRIFETYPKPVLKKLCEGRWPQVQRYKTDVHHRNLLCEILKIESADEIASDDDIDAVICALTAVAKENECWSPSDYKIDDRTLERHELPGGYRLLSRNSFEKIDKIEVSSECYLDWMKRCS